MYNHTSTLFAPLLVLVLFLGACAADVLLPPMQPAWAPTVADHEGGPRVLLASPKGETDASEVISVLFDRPMDPGVRLQTEPPLKGEQQWWGPQTLVFAPEAPLPLATHFTAWIDEDAPAIDGSVLKDGALWTFSTRRPALVSVTPGAEEMLPATEQVMTLVWDQPMDLSSLQERLGLSRLYEKYRAVPFTLRYVVDAKGQEDKTRIQVLPRRRLPPGSRVDLTLQSGAQGLEGRLPSQRTWQHRLVVAPANATPMEVAAPSVKVPLLVRVQEARTLAKMHVTAMPPQPQPGQPYRLTGVLSPPPSQALRARIVSASGSVGPALPVHLSAEGGFHLQTTAEVQSRRGPSMLWLETLEGARYAQGVFAVGSPAHTVEGLALRAQHSVLPTGERLQIQVQSTSPGLIHVTLEQWSASGWRATSLCQVEASQEGTFCGFSPKETGVYRVVAAAPDVARSVPRPSLLVQVSEPSSEALHVDIELPTSGDAFRVRVLQGDTPVEGHVSLVVTEPGGQLVSSRVFIPAPKAGAYVWLEELGLRDSRHLFAFAFDRRGRHGGDRRVWPSSGFYTLGWSLPRSLRQGDELVSNVRLSAAQSAASTWKIWSEPAGLLELAVAQNKGILGPKPQEVTVQMKARRAGLGKVCVQVSGEEVQATRCHTMEVQPQVVHEVHTVFVLNQAARFPAPAPEALLHHIGIAHGPQASAWSLWDRLKRRPLTRTLRDEVGRTMALVWLLEAPQQKLLGPSVIRQVRQELASRVLALAALQLPEGDFAAWEGWEQANILLSIWAVMALEDAQAHTALPEEVLSKAQDFMALLLERRRVPLTLRRLRLDELALATFWRARRTPARLSVARDLEPLRARQKELSLGALATFTRAWAALGPGRKQAPPQGLLQAVMSDPALLRADLGTQAQALALLVHFAPDARRTKQLADALRHDWMNGDFLHQIMALRALRALHAKRAPGQAAASVRVMEPLGEDVGERVTPLPKESPGLVRRPDAVRPWVGVDPKGGALTAHLVWQVEAGEARTGGEGWSLTRTLSQGPSSRAGALLMNLRVVVPEATEGVLIEIPLPSGASATLGASPSSIGARRVGEVVQWREGNVWMLRVEAMAAGVVQLPVWLTPSHAGLLKVPPARLSVANDAKPYASTSAAVWEVAP